MNNTKKEGMFGCGRCRGLDYYGHLKCMDLEETMRRKHALLN